MKEHTLNHILSINDGYGEFTSLIASQSNSAGGKRLYLVTIISVSSMDTYFRIEHNFVVKIVDTIESAIEEYNNIK